MNGLFDNYYNRYEDEISKAMRGVPGKHAFFIRAKAKKLEDLSYSLQGRANRLQVLDIGCGTGLVEQILRIPNADITGLDVSEPLLEKARTNVPGCRFTCFDGQKIEEEDNSYHVVFAINVFHHVSVKHQRPLIKEMVRVLRPDGMLALFEHNPWHPVTRFVVARCGFDHDALLLKRSDVCSLLRSAGLHHIDSSYIIFVPWGIGVNRVLERLWGWLPLGVQYYVAGIK